MLYWQLEIFNGFFPLTGSHHSHTHTRNIPEEIRRNNNSIYRKNKYFS